MKEGTWFKRVAILLLACCSITASFFYCTAKAVFAAPQAVKSFQLYATDGELILPDGTVVYTWGYSLKNEKGTAIYPAPALVVNEGDQVEVTLTNIGPEKKGINLAAHTIHFHGLDTDQANDGVPHTSAAIEVGKSFTYRFQATHAGTYFYHCHVDTVEHLQMGMFGSFIVKAKDGVNQAWTDGPSYDREYAFLLNEIDPVWHKAVEEGKDYDRTDFHPRYWTINGKAFPDTELSPDTTIYAKVGEKVLVRLINGGYQEHSFHLHGHHFQVIASDGRPLASPMEKDTINIGPGERYDILVTFTQTGDFPFHSHNIVDNTNDGKYPGGLHTMTYITEEGKKKKMLLKQGQKVATIDDQTLELNVPPIISAGSTYVPLRFLGEQLGAAIEWIEKEQSVIYKTNAVNIQLWIGKKMAVINGSVINLNSSPFIQNGSTMVPLRFVSENLGAQVDYDAKSSVISVTYEVAVQASHMDHEGNDHGETTDPANQTDSSEVKVNIAKLSYSVSELRIKKGTKVTWTNSDLLYHTVTAKNGEFNSGIIVSKGSWSYTFEETGTFDYYCTTHPTMRAKVIVEN